MQPENPKQKPQGKTPGKLEKWLKARKWKKETRIRDLSKKHDWTMKPSKDEKADMSRKITVLDAASSMLQGLYSVKRGEKTIDTLIDEIEDMPIPKAAQPQPPRLAGPRDERSALSGGTLQTWREADDGTGAASSEPRTQEVIEIDASGKAQPPFTEPNPHSSEPEWPDVIGSGGQSPSEASSEHCPGPRQHGHPLVYESHCDHGETQPHEIAASSEPQDAEAKLLSKINKAVRDKDATAFLAAIESSRSEPQKWTPEYLDELLDLKFERGPVAMSVPDYYVRLQSVADNINAEREQAKSWEQVAIKEEKVARKAERSLADERELREQENDGAVKIIAALNAKLLAAQAAMEWAAKVLDLGESVQAEEILLNALASAKEQP